MPRALTLILLAACGRSPAPASPHANAIDRDRAVEIARATATQDGYDLSRYKLDFVKEEPATWWVQFVVVPVPPPGGFFAVYVDRRDGAARLVPGK